MGTRLQHRTALVTGSTSGIGQGIAAALAAEGAHVVVSGRDEARGAAVVDAIEAGGGRASFVAADLGGTPDELRSFADQAVEALGSPPDILVHNAGIYPSGPTVEVADETLDAILAVNVRAPHVLTAALVPAMVERGSGTVITVGSWISTVGMPYGAIYGATKAAVEQLSRAWAAEFGPAGVRFNAIAPGITDTPGNSGSLAFLEEAAAKFPGRRLGTPADIGAAAVYLASDDAGYVHGATLVVDGGALATRTL
jgi:NAD(P)-dependent dehydrogenase (short-subunit alcohol dehydrogenase family)